VEPKVFSPYKTRRGHVPRKIEVERRKRKFAHVDLTETFLSNGVISKLQSYFAYSGKNSVDGMSLSLFDNTMFYSRSVAEWINYIESSSSAGIPARGLLVKNPKFAEDPLDIEWRHCTVMGGDLSSGTFSVVYDKVASLKPGSKVSTNNEVLSATLEVIYVCFDAEDPELYCQRVLEAVQLKQRVSDAIAMNLYVDCMPVDNLKPLDSEQVHRILGNAINTEKLRHNPLLDTSSLLQQYNLNHMRTMNKLIFSNMLKTQRADLAAQRAVSTDPSIFESASSVFPAYRLISTDSDTPLEERCRLFKFCSLWNKMESIQIMLQVQLENTHLEKPLFFATPEKTQRVEEFTMNQAAASKAVTDLIRDTYMTAIANSVKNNLKDVKKGWFNVSESNVEVYKFSKLRKFLYRVNFMMEDSIRDMMYRMIGEYCSMISQFCPASVRISSSEVVEVVGGRFPMFTIDLKFVNAVGAIPAKFVYSAGREQLTTVILSQFDQAFKNFKGITKVERRVMKKLFWAYDPVMTIPHCEEEWAITYRKQLEENLLRALTPLDVYLETLTAFKDLIQIDINAYSANAEAKFFAGETINMTELTALARKHAVDSEAIFYLLPTIINVGLVMIDLKSVKTMLAAKHKAIAAKLFQLVERKTREYAEIIVNEFRDMYSVITVSPNDIEKLTELKEYMAVLPGKIDAISSKIATNDLHFQLLESAKWQIPFDSMDMRWEVFRWPGKMTAEMAKQEKNHRVLEHSYKKAMEDEQSEFTNDLGNLQSDVSKLKELTKLGDAAKNAEKVRLLRTSILHAEEKAKLFNSREGLFNSTITEYSELSDVTKIFEPFFDLWDCAEKWLSNKEMWTNGPFLNLDAEAVEASVNLLLRNLSKSAKTFERLNLSQCNVIAAQVRDEVDEFRIKVPLIIALRNAGMRDRHWDELAQKTKVKFPVDKSELTLQRLVDLGLVDLLQDVEKVAEKAGKEFGIETALEKMTKAWEAVMMQIESYKETGSYIVKGVDEIMSLLDEHITMTQAMAFSAFKGPFEQRIDSWNASLQVISEVMDEWVALQKNWLYLQPIFDSEDINKQLPVEGKRFATVDKQWRATMQNAQKGVLAVRFCDDMRLLERFKEGNKLLDLVQKGLSEYLETKRAGFSRFYFLSNEELLEILSETKDPLRVQPHLRKCFEGIKSVNFQPDLTITGMFSPENEYIYFVKPVDPKGKNIEHWMCDLKDAMVAGVKNNFMCAARDYVLVSRTDWMQKWAGQVVLNCSQLYWTREVEELLKLKGNEGCWEYYHQLCKQLEDMVILIRGNISKLARVTVGALAVVDVHARDVQKKIAEAGVAKVTDFDWISQMRYYWEGGDIEKDLGDLAVIMVSSKRWYGFEYLGNTFRLVITPLTDKCYLTLMGALQMILGGAPAGPAGTGKTETTKGKNLKCLQTFSCFTVVNSLLCIVIRRSCKSTR
jgi:dynein heavy chain